MMSASGRSASAASRVSRGNNGENFCTMCCQMFEMLDFNARVSGMHYEKWTSVIDSAEAGCLLCIQVMSELVGDELERLLESIKNEPRTNEAHLRVEIETESPLVSESPPFLYFSARFIDVNVRVGFCYQRSAEIRGEYKIPEVLTGAVGALSDDTESEKTFDIIHTWLSTCTKDHEDCRSHGDSGWMPTRLVDVMNDNEDRISLTTSDMINPPATYTTLSHCWGGHVSIMLTTDTRETLERGYPVSALPKTFSDAVQITRRLGIRYLWIDSLCIQQDSVEDWRKESQLMHLVYSLSWCNIAASSASNSSVGCFFKRDPRHVQPFEAVVRWPGADGGSAPCTFSKKELYGKHIENGPLAERGWVMQERVLAPRQINFSKVGVWWECRTVRAAEYFPNGPYITSWPPNGKLLAHHLEQPADKILREETISLGGFEAPWRTVTIKDGVYTEWHTLLARYSATALTKDRDRLVAISGLAKKIQASLGDVYVAGLWRSRLFVELCWSVFPPRKGIQPFVGGGMDNGKYRAPRPRPLLAPTWSWASTLSKFRTARQEFAYTLGNEILDIHLEHATADSTGDVTDGYMKLRVLFGTAMLHYKGPEATLVPMSDPVSYTMSEPLGVFVPRGFCFMDEDVSKEDLGDSCPCIVLYLDNSGQAGGLLLRQIDESGAHYERIGSWNLSLGSRELKQRFDKLSEQDLKDMYKEIVIH